jgi:TetR/AcrR family transcriptional repressor of lmrAB and yxaGH operons
MKKGEVSRAKLVSAAGKLLRRQGYHGTGLAEIVSESGAPRGSLYFYFPGGKEELACEAIEASGAEWRARLASVIEGARDPGEAIEAVCRELAKDLVASKFENGCPVATVALEAAGTSESVRKACAAQFENWEKLIAEKLVAQGLPAAAAEAVGTFVLGAVEGAMLLARSRRDPAPLIRAGVIMNQLFKHQSAGRTKV